MGFQCTDEVLLFFVLFYIQLIHCMPGAFPDEPFNCNRYGDYSSHDWSCRPADLFDMLDDDKLKDDVVTGDEFLREAGARCSNETLLPSYINCMGTLSVECPKQFADVADSLRNKISMFCDGNDVSEWLQLAMNSGFSFNLNCSAVMDEVFTECVKELDIYKKIPGPNLTFAVAAEILPPIISELFHCSKRQLELAPTQSNGCDSSWRNILLNLWLQMQIFGSIYSNLSHEDAQELLALVSNNGRTEILI
ncbi:uncharacterized protein LOC132722411 isoform X2 [Ruditapes philippinarum]|uniref:uncharacterized protein LOC132722411 isoform X2 n=1 Tax=Ruditapes philippinarum TaxID=129788 RepID=UPI00295BE191|nr:uncharacterized protein LOC132722411 isoform X2 [Ruditapes philippinarum]